MCVLLGDEAVTRGAEGLLADTKLIMLAGVSCLSDEEVGLLHRYVRLGGIQQAIDRNRLRSATR